MLVIDDVNLISERHIEKVQELVSKLLKQKIYELSYYLERVRFIRAV